MNVASLVNRLRLYVARALIRRVDDSGGLQIVQVAIQAGVTRDSAERFQQYGLTSVPYPDAECVTVSVGGNTDHQIVINVDDRRYRLRGMKTGEAALYDDLGQTVHLTRDGMVIRGAGLPMLLTETTKITLDSDVHVTGGLTVEGDTDLQGDRVDHQGRNIGRQHQHDNVENGPDRSGFPVE